MWISKKRYEEFKKLGDEVERLNSKIEQIDDNRAFLKSRIKSLTEEIEVYEGKKRKPDVLCEGCKYYITGIGEDTFSKKKYHGCTLNRSCKDFEEKDKTDMEQVIEFIEKLGKGNLY